MGVIRLDEHLRRNPPGKELPTRNPPGINPPGRKPPGKPPASHPPGHYPRPNPRYGRVFFALRQRFELSVEECLLVDVVQTLSGRTGWCFASRPYLARLFGVSPRTLQRMIARLKAAGLVRSHPRERRQLQPTSRWVEAKLSLEG